MRLLLTLAMVALVAMPALADRDMTGGTCDILAPAFLVPEAVNTIEFLITNNSPDTQWTMDVTFTFPECFEITGGYYTDSGSQLDALYTFTYNGNVVIFVDGDGGYGEIYGNGDTCNFFVEVIPHCDCGEYSIHWHQQGDDWGDPPFFVEGDVLINVCDMTATQESSWTSVKSLY